MRVNCLQHAKTNEEQKGFKGPREEAVRDRRKRIALKSEEKCVQRRHREEQQPHAASRRVKGNGDRTCLFPL